MSHIIYHISYFIKNSFPGHTQFFTNVQESLERVDSAFLDCDAHSGKAMPTESLLGCEEIDTRGPWLYRNL